MVHRLEPQSTPPCGPPYPSPPPPPLPFQLPHILSARPVPDILFGPPGLFRPARSRTFFSARPVSFGPPGPGHSFRPARSRRSRRNRLAGIGGSEGERERERVGGGEGEGEGERERERERGRGREAEAGNRDRGKEEPRCECEQACAALAAVGQSGGQASTGDRDRWSRRGVPLGARFEGHAGVLAGWLAGLRGKSHTLAGKVLGARLGGEVSDLMRRMRCDSACGRVVGAYVWQCRHTLRTMCLCVRVCV
jgi:hypothetical protein